MNATPSLTALAPMLALALATACGRDQADGARAAGNQTARGTAPPSVRYDQHISAGGIAPPAGNLRNPFAGQAKSATEGGGLFTSMNCDGCHSLGAVGLIAPSLSDGRWRYGGADGAIFYSIYYGRPQGMPAYGGILTAEITWKLVTYLQSLPPPKDIPTESW